MELLAPILSVGDSGSSSTDGITKNQTLTFSGSLLPGQKVQVFDDESDISLDGVLIFDVEGGWTFTVDLSEGSHTITYSVTSIDNVPLKITSPPLTVTVDFTAPTAPTALALDAASDSGVLDTDNITRKTTPTVLGSGGVEGDIVTLYEGATVLGTGEVDANGFWSVTVDALSEATHTVSATFKDVAGNESAPSSPIKVTVDVTAPSAPTGLDLDADSDLGISDTDDLTSNPNPTFVGSNGVAGDIVTLYEGTTVLGTDEVDANGFWSVTVDALSEATHIVSATFKDVAGNESAPSSPIKVTVDVTAPSAPTGFDLDADSDLGISDTDDLTSNPNPTFVGSNGVAGDIVTLYEGTTVLGTGEVDANGFWSVTVDALSEATHTVSATFKDVAGNESAPSSPIKVTVDVTAPSAPTGLDLDADSDLGISDTDDLTSNPNPTFVGSNGALGDTVTLYEVSSSDYKDYEGFNLFTGRDIRVLGSSTITNADGSWSLSVEEALSDGSHTIFAAFEDAAGNESEQSSALTFTIDTISPSAPTSAPDLSTASDTGTSSSDNMTNDTTPTFVGEPGSAIPGDLVTLYEGISDVEPIGTGIVADDGSWSVTASTLGGGVNTVSFTLSDAAGNESDFSPELSVTIEGVAPKAPSASQLDVLSDSGVSNSDNLTNDTTPTFRGSNQPGNTIELFAGAASLGKATVDLAGEWSLTPSTVFADGSYQITLTATSPAGLTSDASPSAPLTIDTKPATATIFKIAQPQSGGDVNAITLEFSEAVTNFDPSDLNLTLNGQTVSLNGATLTTTDNQTWTLGNLAGLSQASGDYQISFKPGNDIADFAGNVLTTGNSEGWVKGSTAEVPSDFVFKASKTSVHLTDGNSNGVLRGKKGGDLLEGQGGKDKLFGRGGNDKLEGGKGKDQLLGGEGDDVLIGGAGKDFLQGGKGADIYTFNSLKEAGDVVKGFDTSNDLIDVRGIFSAPQFQAENRFAQYRQFIQLVQVGANTAVQVDTDGSGAGSAFTTVVTLQNVLASSLQANNFVVA